VVAEAPAELGRLNRPLRNLWFSSADIHRLKIALSNNNLRMEVGAEYFVFVKR
jgi:hypothetical protein